ncbi:hypothetical protein PLICRDRAFT_94934 [Plicaturopsis crispa FD-325 SS-3]|uniref:Deacetylase sirtuin-type domain-containing protein n=1 Tax=Plicaturopsis crispa FD-325 SS-3 TaxID=944288 RepID=A0A0C9SY51_PLICR|nr:hypothetical protein PLICRDRAFT_94934 [Plicaturopsis crispa FD-325 SS-3]
MAPSSDYKEFTDSLALAKRVVVLAGAGLSAGSGIPTYRGVGGLWKKQDPKKLATLDAFKRDPSLVWQFYHYRRELCLRAQPNAAHRALAELSIRDTRNRIMPSLTSTEPPLFITQNFDSLSPRALNDLADQLTSDEMKTVQNRLIEMHGSAFRTVCTQCKHVNFTYDSPLSPALADTSEVSFETPRDIPIDQLPRCGGPEWKGSNRYAKCGGLLRPAVVWFGEVPEGLGEISKELNWTDLLIVVGTSSLVYPAAGFSKTVRERGGKVAVFNLEPSADDTCDFMFLGPCEETLPKALGCNCAPSIHTTAIEQIS